MNIYNSGALTSSEDGQYRLLVDSITDYAIFMLDRNGLVSSWNAGARRIKGYERYEIIGEHFSKFYTPEDRAGGLPERVLGTAAREGRFEGEGWRVRKNGERFWAHVVIDPIIGPHDEVVGYAKITRDLTERMEARLALRKSEDQFRRLVQGVTDYAIFMLNQHGEVSSWNPGAERIKGYREKEILGRHFSVFYTADDLNAGVPNIGLATAAREGRWETEGWRVRKDGSKFMAHVIIDAIHDERGRLVGYAKVTRDITERLRTQNALEQAQRALFQSQKLESLGQVTGGIAHDFNNLLTAVLNSIALAQRRTTDAEAREHLSHATLAAERGTALIQRMLAFARRQDLSIAPVDLAYVLNGMRGLIERSVGPAVQVEVDVPEGLPCLLCDTNQLESAVLNLAVNARDAMPDGGTLAIAARLEPARAGTDPAEHATGYVVLSVTDTGVGMDAATLARAVDPFFTTKGPGVGSGLGLSMVQGLAEQLGGRLELTSAPGQGTCVALWLPAIRDASPAPSDPPPAEAVRPALKPSAGRVLLVDDDSAVRTSTKALLEAHGYCVLDTDSGMTALKIAAQEPDLDVLVTDQMMPGMTGTQLLEALRAFRPTLPALIATGYSDPGVAVPASAARISKPFKFEELARAIDALLQGKD